MQQQAERKALSGTPVKVLTVAIIFTLAVLVTANVAADRLPVLNDTSLAPQDITTFEGFTSVIDDASHFTQEETVKGEEPVGRLDKSGLVTYDPLETIKAVFGNEVELL